MLAAARMAHAAARALAAPRVRARTLLPCDAAWHALAPPHRACIAARIASSMRRPQLSPPRRAFAAAAGDAASGSEDAAVAALPASNVSFIGSAQNAYVKHAVKLRTRCAPVAALAHLPPPCALTCCAACRPRSRSYREAAGTVLLSGGRILEELSGAADGEESGGGAPRPPLLARVLLLAPGAPPPRGVQAERTLGASLEVLRKVLAPPCACRVALSSSVASAGVTRSARASDGGR